MPKVRVPKKAAAVKAIISPTDPRIKVKEQRAKQKAAARAPTAKNLPAVSSSLFFTYNEALGPPYHVLVDTNFINFAIQNKLDLHKVRGRRVERELAKSHSVCCVAQGAMDCLVAKCSIYITDCVMGELEKVRKRGVEPST